MDELTQSERAQLMSWRRTAPPADFADRVITARSAYRRRRFAMGSALAVAAAAAVVVVLARPDAADAPSHGPPIATAPIAGGPTPSPSPVQAAKKELVVTLPLHAAQPGARMVRVFDTHDSTAIVFRVDLSGSRCSGRSRSVSVTLTPDRGEITMLQNAGDRLTLESNVISVPRGAYQAYVKCGGAAETAMEVQTFNLVVAPWDEPSDPDYVAVHLDPNQPFEITYAHSIPRIIIDDAHNEFDVDVYDTSHVNAKDSKPRKPAWSQHVTGNELLMPQLADYEVDVRPGAVRLARQGAPRLGVIVIRRNQTVSHLEVRTVHQTSTERGLQFDLVWAYGWNVVKTDSPLGRMSCIDCRASYTIFEEADFPIDRALSSPDAGDQYYVIR